MNDNIRKLLILQDRDMKFLRLEDELESLDPEREATKRESLNRQQVLEQAKQHMIQLEVRRKDLDNDVEAKKEQIQKYAQQQLETRKNEEYTALGREIDHVKETISKIEDEELELMEEIDAYKPKIEEAKAELRRMAAQQEVDDAKANAANAAPTGTGSGGGGDCVRGGGGRVVFLVFRCACLFGVSLRVSSPFFRQKETFVFFPSMMMMMLKR